MTRLPIESRLAVDRPDLPEYELNTYCPITGESWGLEAHHIFRRSAGYPSWWVELPDGEVIGNRIRLSHDVHEKVTTNKSRILFENGVYYYVEGESKAAMRWQPPTLHQRKAPTLAEGAVNITWVPSNTWAADPEAQELGGYAEAPSEGEECKLCKRRVPHKKKASSPSTKVFSCRIPIDDAETFSEIVDAAAEHAGMKAKPHHVFNTILVGMTLILQAPKGDLPDVG